MIWAATLGALSLHGTEAGGVSWFVSRDRFSGWDNGAASTVAEQQRPRSDGAWTGGAYRRGLHLVIGGVIQAPSDAALLDARDRLKAACTLTPTTLTILEGGVTRSMTVQREDEVLFTRITPGKARYSVQLLAADSRKFGAELTGSTGLPSSSGGLSVPFSVPFSIGATSTSGQVSLVNAGNATGPVRLRIDGPVVGPVVTHVASGLSLVFATSLALGVGEFVTVDLERHEVLAQGQTGRNGWVTGRGWFGFEPGVNVFSFTAVSGSGTLTVWATEAWE